MSSLTKLDAKCEKCSYKEDCKNKRMAACLVIDTKISAEEFFENAIEVAKVSSQYGLSAEYIDKQQEIFKHNCK
jgi:hypothetical protein